MSEPDTKFAVELPDGTFLEKRDLIEHLDHGPMVVDQISVGASCKRVQLQSDLGPEGLQMTGDEIREQWGETIHTDPVQIHQTNPSVRMEGIHLPNSEFGVKVDLEVFGDEMDNVEPVAMYAKDRIVRAMQAVDRGKHPNDVEGAEVGFDWEKIAQKGSEEQ